MATTIQQIELPKKARAVDTSSGQQTVNSNLITNGAFASDTAWSKSNGTISGGKGVLDGTSVVAMLWQDVLTNGETYRVTFEDFSQTLVEFDDKDKRVFIETFLEKIKKGALNQSTNIKTSKFYILNNLCFL